MTTDSRIALENTSDKVIDFFEASIHSILYQRGVYPCEEFEKQQRYGVPILMSNNPELIEYLDEVIQQLKAWVKTDHVKKLVLVIKSKDTMETLERWQFDMNVVNKDDTQTLSNISLGEGDSSAAKQIRAIMRQIVASSSYLPILDDDDCTFNIHVYTSQEAEIPTTWADTPADLISGGGEHVRLNPFSTSGHQIETVVSYRVKNPF